MPESHFFPCDEGGQGGGRVSMCVRAWIAWLVEQSPERSPGSIPSPGPSSPRYSSRSKAPRLFLATDASVSVAPSSPRKHP